MTPELSLKKNIAEIVDEEFTGCLVSLKNLDVHEAVHDIRKRLKKLRALTRLFRDELGEEKYKSCNIWFRDLGRELSDLRDLTAHMETIENLRARYGKYLYKNFFDHNLKILEQEREVMARRLKENNFFSEYLNDKLEHGKEQFNSWPIENEDIKIILPSIKRVYKRGRKAMKKAFKNPSAKNFHQWRKRVKYLWYQCLLLQEIWPQFFDTLETEIHLLADYLGDDHDLMVLDDKLHSEDFNLKDAEQAQLYQALISEFSDHLREQAEIKGKLIYAEKPKDFRNRIETYTEVNWN